MKTPGDLTSLGTFLDERGPFYHSRSGFGLEVISGSLFGLLGGGSGSEDFSRSLD